MISDGARGGIDQGRGCSILHLSLAGHYGWYVDLFIQLFYCLLITRTTAGRRRFLGLFTLTAF